MSNGANNNKKKNVGKKAQKGSRTSLVTQVRPANAFKLSSCGEKYLDSLLDPFEGPADACVPNWPSFPSQKLRCFARGYLNVGTSGMGFLITRPSAANDITAGYVSTSAFAGTTLDVAAAGVSAFQNNSTFTNAQLGAGAGASQRLVSHGIRVRYTGTELSRGGALYTLEAPEHQTLVGDSVASMRQYDACHSFPVDKEWTQVCWLPVASQEMEYFANALPPSHSGTGPNSGYPLAIAIQSSNGNSFEFEAFWNFEVIGSAVRSKTKSDTDLTGLGVVSGALPSPNGGAVDRAVVLHRDKRPQRGSTLPGILKAVGSYAWKQLSGFVSDPKSIAGVAGAIAPMLLA
jgi:hypothetical protein